MITAEELETRIMNLLLEKGKGYKQQVEMLRTCQLYLTTNPSLDFVEKEFDRISKCIMRRDALFDATHKKDKILPSYYSALKATHDRENNTDYLRSQLQALAIILQK